MNQPLKIILSVVVLAAGAGTAVTLVKTRPKAKKAQTGSLLTTVEVVALEPKSESVVINAMGAVGPAREVVLQPEVMGRVVWQNEKLVPGGQFEKGETILRIDPRNYSMAVAQQKANVERARFELKVEKGRGTVAAREWKILDGKSANEEGRALALRKPHLVNAEAALAAAESALERAELDVARTAVRAPFNGFIKAESVEIGQLVSSNSQLATLVGTDAFWVQVSVPVDRLGWVALPGEDEPGSEAFVSQDVGGARIERRGHVVRLLGDLDPKGRMARLIVAIDDPFGLKAGGKELPLLLGAYVNVAISGDALNDVYEVPRTALHAGDSVLLANESSELEIRKVNIAWRKSNVVYVRSGIQAGDKLIVSRVPSVLSGMKLDVRWKRGGASPAASVEKPKPAAVIEAEAEAPNE